MNLNLILLQHSTFDPLPFILILSYVISIIIILVVVINIVKISKNLETMKKTSSTSFKLREKAIVENVNGNTEEALRLIKSAFIIDCMNCIELNYRALEARNKESMQCAFEYSRYKHLFPELNETYFLEELEKLNKSYMSKTN